MMNGYNDENDFIDEAMLKDDKIATSDAVSAVAAVSNEIHNCTQG